MQPASMTHHCRPAWVESDQKVMVQRQGWILWSWTAFAAAPGWSHFRDQTCTRGGLG